jgi:predicted CoA-binding protein
VDSVNDQIEQFLDGSPHAVVGASPKREKYGNKVLRSYMQNDRVAFPVHPAVDEIEGLTAYPDLASLPEIPHGVSIITPPAVTERIIAEAAELGIRHLWLQPGAENETAVRLAEQHDMNIIASGPCLLVTLRFREV